jgi:uncharacterized repeat protein (TIGR03833 family)
LSRVFCGGNFAFGGLIRFGKKGNNVEKKPVKGMSLLFSHSELKAMDGRNRADIKAGARVLIVQKQDQRSGRLTEGVVSQILTSSPTHPHGVKVRLTSGLVGRVKKIIP